MQREIAYNESNYEVESFELILGYVPGYNQEELERKSEYDSIEKFNSLYYQIAEKTYREKDVFVTALINKSRVIYPGAPVGGEKVYVIKGTRNPQYTEDKEEYKNAVNRIAEVLATYLKQTTYSIVWRNERYEYFKKE